MMIPHDQLPAGPAQQNQESIQDLLKHDLLKIVDEVDTPYLTDELRDWTRKRIEIYLRKGISDPWKILSSMTYGASYHRERKHYINISRLHFIRGIANILRQRPNSTQAAIEQWNRIFKTAVEKTVEIIKWEHSIAQHGYNPPLKHLRVTEPSYSSEEVDLIFNVTERIGTADDPVQIIELFKELGIQDSRWKNWRWMYSGANKAEDACGIGKNLQVVCEAVTKRFLKWQEFIDWMDERVHIKNERPDPSAVMTKKVKECTTPDQFKSFFRELLVPESKWKSGYWIQKIAKLPLDQGGIGMHLDGLYHAIRSDPRFKNSYPFFVAWMEARLPLTFEHEIQAQEMLRQEILRLRQSGVWIVKADAGPISEAEWAEIRKPAYVKKNIVVKTVANFLKKTTTHDPIPFEVQ